VEEIQDYIEEELMRSERKDVARAYIRYRFKKEMLRQTSETYSGILELVEMQNEELKDENSNKNAIVASTQRDYMAGEVSKDLSHRTLLPTEVIRAHDAGEIHFHDMDYFAQHIHNCCLVNLEDMFQNSTVINKTMIETPHSFSTVCNIATQIMAIVASGQYGGQTVTLSHLAPFVDVSRQKLKKLVYKDFYRITGKDVFNLTDKDELLIAELTEERVKEEIRKGVQTIQYQINTLNTSNGQTQFVTIFMYLNEVKDPRTKYDLALIIEEVLKQRIQGVKNEKGVWVTPAFPKLIYTLEDDNITEDSPYWYLTELAAKCTAKRLVPDYISEKVMLQLKKDAKGEGHCYPCMGCRSFLTPYLDENGDPKYYGRFNQGVVTINLVDVACSVDNESDFWDLLVKRLELCHLALQERHKRLEGTPSDISPVHWQYGALARLEKGETIDKLLHNGYSTLSLGYAGLWECVYKMTGHKLTEPEGKEFGLRVMRALNDACAVWKSFEKIDYSLYGTPIESTTYKFASCLKKKFGVIPGVTDKEWYTNSYHVCPMEEIDAFSKIDFESSFQEYSSGGCISYIEIPNLENNLEAIDQLVQYMYNNILYCELNTRADFCCECDFHGEVLYDKETDEWYCPQCGCRDQKKVIPTRRTCGYLGSHHWNQGKTEEITNRVLHVD
jgi:ribonucleoside-triphosphate reductase